MPDTTLDIGVRGGREAKALVDGVTQALRLLGQINVANARQSQQSAQSAKAQADSLRGLATAARESLQNQQTLLTNLKAASEATAAASKRAREEAVEAAKVYAKSALEAANYFKTIAEGRLKQAQAQRLTVNLAGGGTASIQNSALIAARRRELQDANENLARARALGRQQIQNAQQVGVAETASARKQVEAQQRVVTQVQKTAQAKELAARAAERAATSEERAAARATASLQRQQQGAAGLQQGLQALRNTVLRLVAAYSGFRAIEGFVAAGLRFNQTIETSRLGIGALITAEADLVDTQGNLITGATALSQAQGLAADQLDKLRVAGIQTAATTEELVTAFQEAVGAGLAVGLTLDQIRQFTVQVAQAASTINLPFNQLNQEVRSILQGTIDRNSRIAKALQLTNQEVALAKQQGRLADLLNEKFKAFNIAGVESVKTFSALRSNIQDAFSVLAGASVQPLFESLKQAGLSALSQIFDFRSAEIQRSFQGLVTGAQEIFQQIGRALADAIAVGVSSARALSEFFERNKQAVKDTAAAVGTMVRSFGQLITAIGTATSDFGRMAGGANALIGLSRILSDLFKTIAENIKLIVTLLTARALVTAIGSLVGAIVAVRGALAGASIGSAGGPVGAGIGALIGLLISGGTAFKLFRGHQKDAALEAARTTSVLQNQKTAVADLVNKYIDTQRALQAKNLTEADAAVLTARLNEINQEFAQNGGQAYVDILNEGNLSIDERIKKLTEMLRVQAEAAFTAASNSKDEIAGLQLQKKLIEERIAAEQKRTGLRPHIADLDALQKVNDQLQIEEERFRTLNDQAKTLGKSLQTALTPPARIQARAHPSEGEGAEAPAIKEARGELDRMRAELDVERAKINAQFAARVIDAEAQLEALLRIDLAEANAELKFLEAQRVEAERKRDRTIKGETPIKRKERQAAANDEIKGILLQEQALGFKRVELTEKFNGQILGLMAERADKETDIQVRALRAQGRELDAALLDIKNRTKQALDKAEQDFKAFSPEIQAQLKLAIQHESFEETLKAFKTEVQRILDVRTNEVALITDRFKLSGKLNAQEKQQQADQIAEANKRAQEAAVALRDQIEQTRTAAAAVGDDTAGFDALLLQLDRVNAKTKVIQQDLEQLQDSLQRDVESAFGDIFTSIFDNSTKASDAIKKMISSMLADFNRLVSARVTQALFNLLFGVASTALTGAAGGAQRGNVTQSGGRALGGPAGPLHGRLQGGIPGVDSIPILAQQDEWFLKPGVRRKYGDAFLRELNELRLPIMPLLSREQIVHTHTQRFAQGGPVNIAGRETARADRQQLEIVGRIGVDPNGMMVFMDGPVFASKVAKGVKSKRNELSRVLAPQSRERR